MPFRERFDCLWCGTSHVARSAQDLEGWASLCPACIGRAGDNGFLRTRLRTALAERSRAASPAPRDASAAAGTTSLEAPVTGGDPDDFYRRTGPFSQGSIQDGAWLMELEAITAWLDGLTLGPVVVELGAGSGWWTPLLASKAESWAYDPSDEALEKVRSRLVAHGLRAHLHRRALDAPADRRVDAVFGAFLLGSAASDEALASRLEAITGWLEHGGSFAFVEARAGAGPRVADGPTGPVSAFDQPELRERLGRHGLRVLSFAPGGRALIAGVAEAVGVGSADADRTPGPAEADARVATRAGR